MTAVIVSFEYRDGSEGYIAGPFTQGVALERIRGVTCMIDVASRLPIARRGHLGEWYRVGDLERSFPTVFIQGY